MGAARDETFGQAGVTPFAHHLVEQRCVTDKLAGLPMHEQDERFTTAEAQRVLIDADVARQKRKDVIDQQAAALLLQTWLDGYRKRTESP